jgi:acetyl esterase/lipase
MHGLERGYAIITAGYRLAPAVRYPENLFDVKDAMRWVAENAGTYLIDPERFVLAGASAGAHLALMAAFTLGVAVFTREPERIRGAAGYPDYVVRAVVDQFGPSDFLSSDSQFEESGYPRMRPPEPGLPSGPDLIMGAPVSGIPNLARFVNPIDNVHRDVPPVLLLHGRYDPVVPYQQSERLYEKIIAVAGPERAEIDISEEFLHADPGYALPESVERIFGFIDRHIG